MLSAMGRREEALGKAEEAEGIYRQLAQARPDAFFESWTKSLWTLALCHRGLENHGAACASFHQAVAALAPAFQHWPAALAPLMSRVVRDYLQSLEQARQQPDMELLGPVLATFQKLPTNQPKA